ncbi:MAG: HNH endonuclease [Flexibacter sp. CG_4_10_14_3_um_filter_32_15]|nr:MAG: HNH endonuclease [Flexibacter sp. CG_4_10_14_3_um_filter_32_15]
MTANELKELVIERAKGLCEYCKSPANISSQPFVLEHIFPKSKGGKTEEMNLAFSCQGCNNHKYIKIKSIDNITNKEVDLFNHRVEKWSTNFSWSADVLTILGITATGRVTVEELKLNRVELQNLRKLLASVGKHPPSN